MAAQATKLALPELCVPALSRRSRRNYTTTLGTTECGNEPFERMPCLNALKRHGLLN